MNDHLDHKGNIDFTAYHKAQKDIGERCMQCGEYMLLSVPGNPRSCASCNRLDTVLDREQGHDYRIRCPKCHQSFDVNDHLEQCGDYDIYQEHDDYEICCVFCEHIFSIVVNVTYTFYSPAIIDDPSAAGD